MSNGDAHWASRKQRSVEQRNTVPIIGVAEEKPTRVDFIETVLSNQAQAEDAASRVLRFLSSAGAGAGARKELSS